MGEKELVTYTMELKSVDKTLFKDLTETVDCNQDAKADEGKLELSLVPTEIIRAIARVRMFGTKKYKDPDNWKQVEAYRYKNALFRHLLAYLDDEDSVDEESGLNHLEHLACNAAFLLQMREDGKQ